MIPMNHKLSQQTPFGSRFGKKTSKKTIQGRAKFVQRLWPSMRGAWALATSLAIFSTSTAVGQSSSSGSTAPLFANPPLMYSGESIGEQYLPSAANFPPPPNIRLSQRTIEVPRRLPQDDGYVTPPYIPDEYFAPPSDEEEFLEQYAGPKLSAYKSGFFQKLSFTETWIDRGNGTSDLGINELELFMTVALPAPTTEWPLLITPYINMRLMDGPVNPDLPARLYEAYVDFMWVPRLSERLIGILAVAPSEYSDFEADGFRMTGKGLLRYDILPERLQLMAGVLYLNRDDIRLLPAGGLIWTPNPDIRYEVFFPKPKLAHRFAYGDEWEDWIYLSGEFGGNSFAIKRANGDDDKVTLRDWRVMLGIERKLNGGAGFRLEIGYVFSRLIEYASATPDVTPGSTAMIRAGIVF